jgi:glutamine amidotransferase
MCRLVAYLGERVVLDEVLFEPDSSIVEQAVHPRMLSAMNLAGFGVLGWNSASPEPALPYAYRTPGLPFYDRNLRALSRKARASALIAHVRGVVLSDREVVNEQNVHPFRYEDVPVALAMNGDLDRFAEIRWELPPLIPNEIGRCIEGTTDSEWLYALILAQLDDPWGSPGAEEVAAAVEEALRLVRDIRFRHGIRRQSAVNLVLSDGTWIVATRFAYDYGWYHEGWTFAGGERRYDYTTLWYAAGTGYGCHDGEWGIGPGSPSTSVIVASEPLTHDRSAWLEAPEYCLLVAKPGEQGLNIDIRELDA